MDDTIATLILKVANAVAPILMVVHQLASPRPNRCRRSWLRFMAANRIALKTKSWR